MALFDDDYATVIEQSTALANQNPATQPSPGSVQPSLWGRISGAFSDFAGDAAESVFSVGSNLVDFQAFETLLSNRPIGFTDQGDQTPVPGQIETVAGVDAKWLLIGGAVVVGLILLVRR